LSTFCERPTSSISLKRPRFVRFAYALALRRRTRSRVLDEREDFDFRFEVVAVFFFAMHSKQAHPAPR